MLDKFTLLVTFQRVALRRALGLAIRHRLGVGLEPQECWAEPEGLEIPVLALLAVPVQPRPQVLACLAVPDVQSRAQVLARLAVHSQPRSQT